MINPIEHIQKILARRRATAEMVCILEAMHEPGGKNEFSVSRLHRALDRGADIYAAGMHKRMEMRVSALSLTVGSPMAATILVERGAQFDNSIVGALKHLVTKSASDLPLFSRTTRSLNDSTIESAQIILAAGAHPGLCKEQFVRDLEQLCEDKTTINHPTRKLGDILDDHIPGFSSVWQRSSLENKMAEAKMETPAGPRRRF